MKRLTIFGIIACVGLLFPPTAAIVGAAGPQDGLKVTVINEQPIPVTGDIGATVSGGVTVTNEESDPVPVTGGVQVTNTPDFNVVNDETNPVPVVLQNAGTTPLRQSLISAGSGGRTIAGPGYINFANGHMLNAIIFMLDDPIIIYACATVQNVGQTYIRFAYPVTFSITPGNTETYCRRFAGDTHIEIQTPTQGVGEFLYRVDLISDVTDN